MRIGVFLRHPFHAAFFTGTISRLQERHQVLATNDPGALTRFMPHVVLSAEDISYLHLRGRLPRSIFVHTRHGLASKGVPENSFRASDYTCVTSEYVREHFESRGIRPRRGFWVIGYLQMDGLLNAARPPQIPHDKRIILYAPTWHQELSSLPLLGRRVVDLILGDRRDSFLVIKPHPLVQQGCKPGTGTWMEAMREACRDRDDVLLLEEKGMDVMPWLKAADVLVSDASSVQLEYLALDRPIILINNPARFGSQHFDPDGFEWAWREMGDEIDDIEELPLAVGRALDDPAHGAAMRQLYRTRLFGRNESGSVTDRLVACIENHAAQAASETGLLLGSVWGRVFHYLVPHLQNLAHAFRSHRRTA